MTSFEDCHPLPSSSSFLCNGRFVTDELTSISLLTLNNPKNSLNNHLIVESCNLLLVVGD
jgi:hypothetical protein